MERLWRAFRAPRRGRIGDADDVQSHGAADGFAHLFDRDTGLWKAVIPPASWKWHWRTPVVEEGDEDDVAADCKLFLWSVRLKTTGSSTTTCELHSVADGLIDTLTLGSGVKRNATTLGYALSAGDGLFTEITGAGTGAAGLLSSAWAKAQ